jgi:quercetin 2,3-dioxygenase
MTLLLRANARHHDHRPTQDVWLSFQPQETQNAFAGGFVSLESLNEVSLAPGAPVVLRQDREGELLTYVREGRLAFRDSDGRRGILQAGDYRRMTVNRTTSGNRANASRADWVHFFEIGLRPLQIASGLGGEQKRFSTAERRGMLRLVAATEGSQGPLRIQQDASIFSALLEAGQHVVHALVPGRSAWLHIVRGEATLGDIVMSTGDGAGIAGEPAVSFTARGPSEILLIDLGESPADACRTGLVRPPDAGTSA